MAVCSAAVLHPGRTVKHVHAATLEIQNRGSRLDNRQLRGRGSPWHPEVRNLR
jgi:hypothetical protein